MLITILQSAIVRNKFNVFVVKAVCVLIVVYTGPTQISHCKRCRSTEECKQSFRSQALRHKINACMCCVCDRCDGCILMDIITDSVHSLSIGLPDIIEECVGPFSVN